MICAILVDQHLKKTEKAFCYHRFITRYVLVIRPFKVSKGCGLLIQ